MRRDETSRLRPPAAALTALVAVAPATVAVATHHQPSPPRPGRRGVTPHRPAPGARGGGGCGPGAGPPGAAGQKAPPAAAGGPPARGRMGTRAARDARGGHDELLAGDRPLDASHGAARAGRAALP